MAAIPQVTFTDVCLNGQLVVGNVKECRLIQQEGRYCLVITLGDQLSFDVDLRKSLTELQYSTWDADIAMDPIMQFMISLRSVPGWLLPYTTSPKGSLQWVLVTMKVKESRANYLSFLAKLNSILPASQRKPLDHSEALALWEKRCSTIKSEVTALNIRLPNFQAFSSPDLKCLKDDKSWLTDSHVTFCLLDSYLKNSRKNIWGNLKITLLDTTFWSSMSEDPNKYHERYRMKVNLVGYDFVVMPMFGHDHWWLGIVEKPNEFMEGKTVFHILDSLPGLGHPKTEASKLQSILLKHFDRAAFEQGRITTNYAEVPRQPNTKDCACFLIFFADTFFANPEWTMGVLKKKSYSSSVERLAAWGLETDDLSFVRRQMRGLLFQYMKEGQAVVEYKKPKLLSNEKAMLT